MRHLLATTGIAVAALLAGLGIVAAGIEGPDPVERADAAPSGAAGPGLRRFGGCEQLRGYLRRHAATRLSTDAVAPGATAMEDSATGVGAAPSAPTGTNLQEEGVDEPDLAKTIDGTLFALAGGRLRSVDVGADVPAVLDSVELPGAEDAGRELLISGDRALVITSGYGYAEAALASYPGAESTLLTELDISDPAAITPLETMRVEGSYLTARLADGTVRLVLSSYPGRPVADRGHGRAFLPATVVHDRVAGTTTRGRLLGCKSVGRPRAFSGQQLLSLLTIGLAQGVEPVDADAVIAAGDVVYGSPTSLYVASTRWLDPEAGAERASTVNTSIHRFDTSEPDATEYAGSGQVEGYMLSQWSMSEHDGVLRVASTTEPPWEQGVQAGETESFVTTLAPDGERLVQLGRVGGLGRGERIYAVRFIDELGYVVTFRQVDPLYTVDLSDPTDPRVTGELKIPGYSAYLHPVGPGLLLGIGQGATADGVVTGVQASLFDVSDPAAPARIDRIALGHGTSTEVEYDHHAFTYSSDHRLAVLPLQRWADDVYEQGAIGVRIEPGAGLSATAPTDDGRSYRSAIRRSFVIDDRVLTVSERGVGVHDAATLERLAFTRFAGD